MKNLKFEQVSYHRNGVSGEPFYAVRFQDHKQPLMGIVFASSRDVPDTGGDSCRVAVIDVVTGGMVENKFRGDYYEPFLLDAVRRFTDHRPTIA